MRKLLLLSNSAVHGSPLLSYAKDTISQFFKEHDVVDVVFIPYALKDYDNYTQKMSEPLRAMGFKVRGIHTFPSAKDAITKAHCVFVGGGNTFRLLKELYNQDLIKIIRKRVMNGQLVYVGSSAGTNVATTSINTTNDMPIVLPPSLDALNLVPFNINPHFVDNDLTSTHMGESRVQRILEFLETKEQGVVVALYEGSLLQIEGNKGLLKGERGAKLFVSNCSHVKETLTDNQDISFLLEGV